MTKKIDVSEIERLVQQNISNREILNIFHPMAIDPKTALAFCEVVRAAKGIEHWADDYENNPLLDRIVAALARFEIGGE